jgi:cytochrome oxidase Cu insertion factor (SCO1/SenC/PrrC family)
VIGPRAKLVLIAALFAVPIAASFFAYRYLRPPPTANYGELLLPPDAVTTQPLEAADGARFTFAQLAGRWILVVSDAGACAADCAAKLVTLRQVRLALGRDASRVARVFVVDDRQMPAPAAFEAFDGTLVALAPAEKKLPPGAGNDRAHIYLVDPRGNVMMRWPAAGDGKGILGDLRRLLKASQIG